MKELEQSSDRVITVLGEILPEDLGKTLMHEHILCDLSGSDTKSTVAFDPHSMRMEERFDRDYHPMWNGNHHLHRKPDLEYDLREFHACGGRSIVELTTGGIMPDPTGLAELSSATGVNIVLGAGFYTDRYVSDDVKQLSVEELARTMVEQITSGAWGTKVRCGIIGEIGVSWPMTPFERRVLEASARAQSATGLSINVHPARHPQSCWDICDILEAAGADLDRVILSHMDRTYPEDVGAVIELAQRCVVEYDFFGIETSMYWMGVVDLPNDWMRLKFLRKIIDAGLTDRVCISQDICTNTRLLKNGGHGYKHIITNVEKLMYDRYFSAVDVETLLIRNPKRLLAAPRQAEAAS